MKQKLNTKNIIYKLVLKRALLAWLMCILFGFAITLFLVLSYLRLLSLIVICISFVMPLIYTMYIIFYYNKLDNWYISKEIVSTTKSVGEDGVYVVLFDNKQIWVGGVADYCYGDIIYVIRNKKDDKPVLLLFEDSIEYIGSKEIIDNTDKYTGKEYSLVRSSGTILVTEETHSYKENTDKFKVTEYTKAEEETRKKLGKIFAIIFLVGFIFSTWSYTNTKIEVTNNWIYTTATITDRKLYSTSGEDYEYKYDISYTADNKECKSYIITTHGSSFDVGKKIDVYVNPNNLEEIKIYGWKTR